MHFLILVSIGLIALFEVSVLITLKSNGTLNVKNYENSGYYEKHHNW